MYAPMVQMVYNFLEYPTYSKHESTNFSSPVLAGGWKTSRNFLKLQCILCLMLSNVNFMHIPNCQCQQKFPTRNTTHLSNGKINAKLCFFRSSTTTKEFLHVYTEIIDLRSFSFFYACDANIFLYAPI